MLSGPKDFSLLILNRSKEYRINKKFGDAKNNNLFIYQEADKVTA